jgi:hypothetical protein
MIKLQRYMPVLAAEIKGELIPIWDENLIFNKADGNYPEELTNQQGDKFINIHEVAFDLKEKKLVQPTILDYYSNIKLRFNNGDTVLVESEKDYRTLYESTIVEVVYEKYTSYIRKGKKFDRAYRAYFPNLEKLPNTLFHIKVWEPSYVLSDGRVIEYEHQLYKKEIK